MIVLSLKKCNKEVQYLQQYDKFKQFIDAHFDMPDSTVSQLIRFWNKIRGGCPNARVTKSLRQALSEKEVSVIEPAYQEVFGTID